MAFSFFVFVNVQVMSALSIPEDFHNACPRGEITTMKNLKCMTFKDSMYTATMTTEFTTMKNHECMTFKDALCTMTMATGEVRLL